MSKGFTFEKDLPHQQAGINAVLSVFSSAIPVEPKDATKKLLSNPKLELTTASYYSNIKAIQEFNGIAHTKEHFDANSNGNPPIFNRS